MNRRRSSTKVMLLGGFLVLGTGLPLMLRLLYSVPVDRVTACTTSWSHKHYAHVTLANGRQLSLTRDDIPEPEKCLLVGVRVEKRAFEMKYRLDGTSVHTTGTLGTVGLIGLLGSGIVLAGWVLRSRGR